MILGFFFFGIRFVVGLVIVGGYCDVNLSIFVVVCVGLFVGCLWWFLPWLWRWFYVVVVDFWVVVVICFC